MVVPLSPPPSGRPAASAACSTRLRIATNTRRRWSLRPLEACGQRCPGKVPSRGARLVSLPSAFCGQTTHCGERRAASTPPDVQRGTWRAAARRARPVPDRRRKGADSGGRGRPRLRSMAPALSQAVTRPGPPPSRRGSRRASGSTAQRRRRDELAGGRVRRRKLPRLARDGRDLIGRHCASQDVRDIGAEKRCRLSIPSHESASSRSPAGSASRWGSSRQLLWPLSRRDPGRFGARGLATVRPTGPRAETAARRRSVSPLDQRQKNRLSGESVLLGPGAPLHRHGRCFNTAARVGPPVRLRCCRRPAAQASK